MVGVGLMDGWMDKRLMLYSAITYLTQSASQAEGVLPEL